MRLNSLSLGIALLAMTPDAHAQDNPRFARAAAAVEAQLHAADTLETYPGRALILVERGKPPIVDVRGRTRAEGGEPVDANTPFYIASMTKAFVGLLAVRLDEMGIMPLDTTIGSVFPEMKVEGVDFDALTMRDALSHQLGFRAVSLNIRTAYTDLVPVEDYPAIVSAAGKANGEAFRYDNLGYLLYAAALEQQTGKSWRAWIDDIVFDPLDMTRTSARTSDFAEVSHNHEVRREGLVEYAPKSDAIMHAAGGLVVSPGDMARWLSANVGVPSAIPASIFDEAQRAQVAIDQREGPIHCTGYAFGWNRCTVGGMTLLQHGGGYVGMRSHMMILPDEGVAMAVMFNSDAMTGGLSGQLLKTFLTAYQSADAQLPTSEEFASVYAARVERLKVAREADEAKAEADPKWGGWRWTPDAKTLAAMTGTYHSPSFGSLELSLSGGQLRGRLNGTALALTPAVTDLFAAQLSTDSDREELRIERDAKGRIEAIVFSGERFSIGS